MTTSLNSQAAAGRSTGTAIKPLVSALSVLVALFGGLSVWRAARTTAPAYKALPPVAVAATIVRAADVPVSIDAVGSLRAVQEVVLAPEVAGRVVDIRFSAGSTVEPGTLLVQLNDEPERADRRSAQAHAAFAQAQIKRSQDLSATGAESRELLEQRRAEADQAVAAVTQIDARIRQKQVRAPFAGEIGIRRINLGQYLNAGDTIATLTALDSLYVELAVPQQELHRINSKLAVAVTSDAFPGRTFTAQVNAIEPKVGENTRNLIVQAVLSNTDRALRPGMYVAASLMLPAKSGTLLVPATAIQTSAGGDFILVVRGADPRHGGKAEIVPVQAGRRIGNDIALTSGIKAGDVVIAEGQLRVQPGAVVRVARLVPIGEH